VNAHDPAMIGHSGYERTAYDAYWTPRWCTEWLCEAVRFRGLIWEPAVGRGDIADVLTDRGYKVMISDIHDHGPNPVIADFLKADAPFDGLLSIITNPPYAEAGQFARKALELTQRSGGMVAMLLRNEFDCAKSRCDLFDREPFSKKLVLTKRPTWSDERKASPRHNFAWFIWDWHHVGPATIRYLGAA
jgi:hypothetical protein